MLTGRKLRNGAGMPENKTIPQAYLQTGPTLCTPCIYKQPEICYF